MGLGAARSTFEELLPLVGDQDAASDVQLSVDLVQNLLQLLCLGHLHHVEVDQFKGVLDRGRVDLGVKTRELGNAEALLGVLVFLVA